MSEKATPTDRDARSGRFVTGCKPGPGRQPGSRNKLTESFIEDLKTVWQEHGATALQRCAIEEPAQFVRVVASLMPKTLDVNMTAEIDASSFAEKFRAACAMLGNEPQPKMKTIEHADVGQRR
jgi:hypothetical protein